METTKIEHTIRREMYAQELQNERNHYLQKRKAVDKAIKYLEREIKNIQYIIDILKGHKNGI